MSSRAYTAGHEERREVRRAAPGRPCRQYRLRWRTKGNVVSWCGLQKPDGVWQEGIKTKSGQHGARPTRRGQQWARAVGVCCAEQWPCARATYPEGPWAISAIAIPELPAARLFPPNAPGQLRLGVLPSTATRAGSVAATLSSAPPPKQMSCT